MADSDRLTRIEDKVDVLGTRLSSIDSTLSAQHVSLKDHIRRTELLEQEIIPLKQRDAAISVMIKLLLFVVSVMEIISLIIRK